MTADTDGYGYWLVARDGGVFAFEAAHYGSRVDDRRELGTKGHVRNITPGPNGSGYCIWDMHGNGRSYGDDHWCSSMAEIFPGYRKYIGFTFDPTFPGWRGTYWGVLNPSGSPFPTNGFDFDFQSYP